MTVPLIEFKKVFKRFGDNAVLKGVDLSIYEGEVTAIIGKSGIGKSVLLKHIIGLLAPDDGQILFAGRAMAEMTAVERRELKAQFSYMFQGSTLFDSMSVYDNVALPLKEKGRVPVAEIKRRVGSMLDRLDLQGIEDKYPSQLSGGMQKRVAMARALVTDPQIVLFDEPTTGLDPIRKNAAHAMIADYQQAFGFTGVMVSHDIPDVFFIAQRVAMLDQGRIIFQGRPDQIQSSREPEIQAFIQGKAPSTGLTGDDKH